MRRSPVIGVAVIAACLLALPGSFQIAVHDVAVSFDGEIAAVVRAADREGRLASAIAWLNEDGSAIRVVRTSPFAAVSIGFTADGSLWAAGVEKVSRDAAHPSHDIIRQYDPEGRLVGPLLSRAEFSQDIWHPALNSFLATSRNYVAFVSEEARTWTLISSAGVVVGHGEVGPPGDCRIIRGAVTDSGRVFINGDHRMTAGT